MANVRWIGGATAVAQVDDITPGGTIEIGDIFNIIVTGENGDTNTITFTATATTVANVTAGLTAAWNASTNYLCTPVTAADATTKLTLTADSAGVPFYISVSTTEAGGGAADDQTIVRAASTANSGPNDYNTALNWSGGVVPGYAADEVIYIEGATIYYGLNQTAGTTGSDSVNIFNSTIGQNPSTGRAAAYLTYDVGTVFNVNRYDGPGSPTFAAPVYLKVTTAAATCTVYNTGTNSDTTIPACNIILTSATSKLLVYGGKIGISYFAGDADSEIASAYVYGSASLSLGSAAFIDNLYWNSTGDISGKMDTAVTRIVCNGGTVDLLTGAIGTLIVNSGTCTVYNDVTTLDLNGGTCYQYDQINIAGSTITTLTQLGGTFYSRATGTVTAANILGGTCDASSEIPRTWTTVKIDPPGVFKCNTATQTLTNKIQPNTATKVITYTAS